MKEIGGYFGLELPRKEEYHQGQIKLNSASNAFKYMGTSKNHHSSSQDQPILIF